MEIRKGGTSAKTVLQCLEGSSLFSSEDGNIFFHEFLKWLRNGGRL